MNLVQRCCRLANRKVSVGRNTIFFIGTLRMVKENGNPRVMYNLDTMFSSNENVESSDNNFAKNYLLTGTK